MSESLQYNPETNTITWKRSPTNPWEWKTGEPSFMNTVQQRGYATRAAQATARNDAKPRVEPKINARKSTKGMKLRPKVLIDQAELLQLRSQGVTREALAEKYGCSRATIGYRLYGRAPQQ